MTEQRAPFAPNWISLPGESIIDLIDERGWTQAELARRMGYTEKHLSQLINGKVSLSRDAALRLENVLGSSFDFWLSLEANYQKHKARLEAIEKHSSWIEWLDKLPIKDLMALNAIPSVRFTASSKPALVESCLRFFGVASPQDWQSVYGEMQVAFRRSKSEQSDVGAISTWLRLGEREIESVGCIKYDKSFFYRALKKIRELTCESPDIFLPQVKELLTKSGVLFALVPSIPRAHVSGVARWLSPTRPLIQLSLYGKYNDRFWFNFFHEAAHILLHSNTVEEKKSIFLDDPNSTHLVDPIEKEANVWAANWLIPTEYVDQLKVLRSRDAVIKFSRELNLHPGIVVGRLQHDGCIRPDWFNDLKDKYQFK